MYGWMIIGGSVELLRRRIARETLRTSPLPASR